MGVVLAGGRSRRFGRDKAVEPVDGVAMAARVAAALRAAGAADVVAVGGDVDRLGALGLTVWPDDAPGEGPLGGIVTALDRAGAAGHAVAVVVPCDLPWLDAPTVAAVVAGLGAAPDAAVAMGVTERGREPLVAAWRVAAGAPVLAGAFAAGERAVHRALGPLAVVEVAVAATAVRNVNQEADLRR